MDKQQFIKYMADRYGIDVAEAEGMTNMFADCLQDLILTGQSVSIDEIGEFKADPLFPDRLSHRNNMLLAKAARQNIVSFKASSKLTMGV